MQAQDLIIKALTLANRVMVGQTPSSVELAAGMDMANQLFDAWNAERLSIPNFRHDALVLTASTASYTIGPSGAFNVPRPIRIEDAGVVMPSGIRYVLKLYTAEEWAAIGEKGQLAQVPEGLYNDRAYPLSTLWLFPVPSGTPTLDIFSWGQLAQFAALTDTLVLSPSYEDALAYNLAVRVAELMPGYIPPRQNIYELAQQSKDRISRLNMPPEPPRSLAEAAEMPMQQQAPSGAQQDQQAQQPQPQQ